MDLLKYSSNEMFSSTELIRKSKMIFNKVSKNEIEKAVILRDGKPAFLLLDFDTYEKIMKEYMSLKKSKINQVKKTKKIDVIKQETKDDEYEDEYENDEIDEDNNYDDEYDMQDNEFEEIGYEELNEDDIDEDEYLKALEEIDNMNFVESEKEDNGTENETEEIEEASTEEKKETPLKEFWEK